MVPLGSVCTVRETNGADKIVRYNMFPAAELSGQPALGISTGQAVAAVEKPREGKSAARFLHGMDGADPPAETGRQQCDLHFPAVCALCLPGALRAVRELALPLAIILIVPMCLLSAIGGVWLRDMDNNIFTQIGFVVLVGLACKNAILIVEFAQQIQHRDGKDAIAAAVEACRLRLRPILMTSFAFILGVVPLVISKGAGAEMRQALGTAVFYGMLGVTGFGLFLTPVFYVVIRKLTGKSKSLAPP